MAFYYPEYSNLVITITHCVGVAEMLYVSYASVALNPL